MEFITLVNEKYKNVLQNSCFNKLFLHTIISIYIDKTTLKVISLERDEGNGVGFCYSRSFENINQEEPWYMQQNILKENLEIVQGKLEAEDYVLKNIEFIIVLAGMVYTEQLELPRLNQQELEEAIAWELPQRVPWTKDTYVYRYVNNIKQADKQEAENLAEILEVTIYCLPQNCLEVLQEVLSKTNITPAGIFIEEELILAKEDFASTLNEVDFYESFYNTQLMQEKRQMYLSPILGALLYSQNKAKVDFLTFEEQRCFYLQKYSSCLRAIALLFVVLSLSIVGLDEIYKHAALREYKEIKNKYLEYSPWLKRMDDMKLLDNKLNSLQNLSEVAQNKRISWSTQLLTLGKCVPEGAWLLQVEQKNEAKENKKGIIHLELIGQVENMNVLAKFVKNLKQNGLYDNVEIVKSSQDKSLEFYKKGNNKNVQDFRITLQVKDKTTEKRYDKE